MLPIKVKADRIHIGDHLQVAFQRTLRIPDDGGSYPLPPGLGCFPVFRVDDYASAVPEEWVDHGGVFIPMYQREAMWLQLRGDWRRPVALQVGVGKVCAITGRKLRGRLDDRRQNYLAVPTQPWLDGINSGHGTIKQFVAAPLGDGYTVEEQVTGRAEHGGLQLVCFESRAEMFPERVGPSWPAGPWLMGSHLEPGFAGGPPRYGTMHTLGAMTNTAPTLRASATRGLAGTQAAVTEMGLAAGGTMRQRINPDPHGGVDAYDPQRRGRVFVHIVNSDVFRQITGRQAPRSPITERSYRQRGLPWFERYDEHLGDVSPAPALAQVKSVAELDQGNRRRRSASDTVRDGAW